MNQHQHPPLSLFITGNASFSIMNESFAAQNDPFIILCLSFIAAILCLLVVCNRLMWQDGRFGNLFPTLTHMRVNSTNTKRKSSCARVCINLITCHTCHPANSINIRFIDFTVVKATFKVVNKGFRAVNATLRKLYFSKYFALAYGIRHGINAVKKT